MSPYKKTKQQKTPAYSLAGSPCLAAHFNYPFRPFFTVSILSSASTPSKKNSAFLYLSHVDDFFYLKPWLLTCFLHHHYHQGSDFHHIWFTHVPLCISAFFSNLLSLLHAKFFFFLKCQYCNRWCFGERGSGAQLRWTDLKLHVKISFPNMDRMLASGVTLTWG